MGYLQKHSPERHWLESKDFCPHTRTVSLAGRPWIGSPCCTWQYTGFLFLQVDSSEPRLLVVLAPNRRKALLALPPERIILIRTVISRSHVMWSYIIIMYYYILISHLEMTRGLIPKSIASNDSNIFKSPDRNGCSLWDERDSDFTRSIGSIHSSSCFVKVHNVTVLLIDKFNDVTLRATQKWWSIV